MEDTVVLPLNLIDPTANKAIYWYGVRRNVSMLVSHNVLRSNFFLVMSHVEMHLQRLAEKEMAEQGVEVWAVEKITTDTAKGKLVEWHCFECPSYTTITHITGNAAALQSLSDGEGGHTHQLRRLMYHGKQTYGALIDNVLYVVV